jgi:hypothetical protein
LVPFNTTLRRKVGERGAGLRLRHRHRDLDFTAANRRHDALLEGFGGEALDGAHRADAGLEHGEAHRGRNLAELLEHQQCLDVAEAEAAVAFGHVDAQEAHLGEFPDDRLVGRVVGLFALPGDVRQFRAGKVARGFLQRALFVGQLEIHAGGLLGF